MASNTTKIRGITVELGGDVSGLKKSLSEVNTSINKTSKELRDVEKLLKLDPTNTELLRQKQQMLASQIEQTKTKLEALKRAEEDMKSRGVDENSSQFQALRREIISTENALQDLEEESVRASTALSKITAVSGQISTVSGKIASSTRALSTAAVAAGTAMVKSFADFEKQLSNVEALLGKKALPGDMDDIKATAQEMAKQTKYSTTEVAEAMSYMALAGWDAKEIIAGIPGVLALAAAGGEDLATTSDIVTDALTAFGLTADDTREFVDALAVTMSSSNTNVAQMGEAFKYVAPVAGAAGYSIEDVSLALGLMANAGIKGSQAGTTLRNVVQKLVDPSKEAAVVMKQMGIALSDDEGHMYSLDTVLKQFRTSFAGLSVDLVDAEGNLREYEDIMHDLEEAGLDVNQAEMLKNASILFGSRAMPGVLALVNAATEDYEELKNEVYAVAEGMENEGYAIDMQNKQLDNFAGRIDKAKTALEVCGQTIGEKLVPFLDKMIDKINDLVEWFSSLDEQEVSNIATWLLVTAALSPVAKAVSTVSGLVSTLSGTVIPKAITIVGKLTGTVIPGLVSKLGVFGTLGIAGLIIALVALIATKGDEIKAIIDKVVSFITNGIQKMIDWLSKTVLGSWLAGVLKTLQGLIQSVGKILDGLIDIIRGVFTGNWTRAWQGVIEVFSGIMSGLATVLKAPLNGVIGLINGVINGINKVKTAVGGSAIPTIPFLANGGVVYSGSAVVGEAGPELLTMQGGHATVQPLTNNTTTNTSYGGVVMNIYGAAGQDIHQLADIIMDEMQAATERKGAVFA